MDLSLLSLLGSGRRSASKRKNTGAETRSRGGSPYTPSKSEAKRMKQAVYVQYDDEDVEPWAILDLLNFRLTSTAYRSVTVRSEESSTAYSSRPIVGAFVYFCSNSQADAVWRACIASHCFQRRFGPCIHFRACPKPNKKIKDETEEEEMLRMLAKNGCFASHLQLDACIIVPVTCSSRSNLLFRGAALVHALNLINEPVYFREGELSLEQFADQEAHKQDARLKIERVEGEMGLYELNGIRWKKTIFEH